LIDDITDAFGPLIQSIEYEVDSIDELVLILKEAEQSDMLRRWVVCWARRLSHGLGWRSRVVGPKGVGAGLELSVEMRMNMREEMDCCSWGMEEIDLKKQGEILTMQDRDVS
jgi:hypothetical protein